MSKKSNGTDLDYIFDWMGEHPKESTALFGGVFVGLCIWRKDWILSHLPFSFENVEIWYSSFLLYTKILCVIVALLWFIRWIFFILRIQRNFEYVQFLPHENDGVSQEMVGQLIRRIHGTKRKWIERLIFGREWYSFVVHYKIDENKGAQYCFYLGAERSKLRALQVNFKSIYPRLEFFPAKEIEFPRKKAVGGRLKLKSNSIKKALPLSRYKTDHLPGILSHMQPGTWLQLAFSANDGWKLKKSIASLEEDIREDKNASERTTFDKEELSSLKHRYAGNEVAFDCTVSLASECYPGVPLLKNVANAINSVLHDVNELRYRRWRRAVEWYPTTKPYRMVWTGSELANLLHLPHFDDKGLMKKLSKQIPHSSRGAELLPEGVLSSTEGIPFGVLNHPFVKNREVRVLPSVLGKHWLLLGVNGSGKSTLINKILMESIYGFLKRKKDEKVPGFSFADPAQDTALVLLNQMLLAELKGADVDWSRVHWISFKNTEYPLAMNLLYKFPGETNEFVTDIIMKIIHENFQVAQQAERLLRHCIETLLADPEETHTLLGVKRLLRDYTFRKRIISRLKGNPETAELYDFWIMEAPDLLDMSTTPILNRIDIFTSNKLFKRMFGQKEFALPVRKWFDEGHIIFYDFSGMSEREISVIGSALTYLYYRVADMRQGKPLLHQFVIDEAAKVKASIFPYMIREQRKKGLSLGIATQSIKNLDKELQSELINVQGNFFVCRQGSEDAQVSTKFFKVAGKNKDESTYTEGFLSGLADRVAVIRTQDHINGVDQTVQAVVEVPPLDRYHEDGTKVDFRNEEDVKKSNAWTLKKAEELSAKNGYHQSEIDLMIQAYMRDEEYVPKKKTVLVSSSPVRKKKAPLSKQPQTPENLKRKAKVDLKKSTDTLHVQPGLMDEKIKKAEENVEQIQEQREQSVSAKVSSGSFMKRVKEQKKIEP
ncbi:hypothetical protein P5775_25715 [Bacillus cereus]|uniref:hypothetical protein n=1 Tax=Bacillus cereus group TaxID=86661 RepID=UPI0011A0CF4C|nr:MULTISPECIES: hypothetical protein [Bacillus cereus group]MDF9626103.1 hypothetical protein [Bacillus cereus]